MPLGIHLLDTGFGALHPASERLLVRGRRHCRRLRRHPLPGLIVRTQGATDGQSRELADCQSPSSEWTGRLSLVR